MDYTIKKPSDLSTRYRLLILCLVALAYYILILHRSVIYYVQPPLKADLGLADADMGWLQAAWVWPYAVAQIFVGYLGDRFRRKTILLWSLTLSALVLGAMSMAESFTHLVLLRCVLGLVQAPSVPAIASVMADCFTPKNRSTAVAVYLVSLQAGIVSAGWWGGTIAEAPWPIPLGFFGGEELLVSGWRMAMLMFFGMGLIVVVVFMLAFREPPRAERMANEGLGTQGAPLWRTLAAVTSVRSYLAIGTVFICVTVVDNASQLWLAPYFVDQFDLELGEAGRLATLWLRIGTCVGLLLGGPWADFWARRARGGRTAVPLIGMGLWIPALFIVGTTDSLMLLKVAMSAFGLGLGLYQANLWTTTFEVIDPAARATAIGFLNVIGGILGAWASPLFGYIQDEGFVSNSGTIVAALSLLGIAGVAIYVVSIKFFLPRDYRGFLK